MTCPVTNANNGTDWQLFAVVPNAAIPTGDIDDCRSILAITYDWEDTTRAGAAAWEYI